MRRLHHELGRDHGNSSQGLGPVDIPHVIAVSLILHGIWHLAYPRLSTDHPAFIGRHELILRVHGAQMKLDLIATFRIYGRAAIGAEIPHAGCPKCVPPLEGKSRRHKTRHRDACDSSGNGRDPRAKARPRLQIGWHHTGSRLLRAPCQSNFGSGKSNDASP